MKKPKLNPGLSRHFDTLSRRLAPFGQRVHARLVGRVAARCHLGGEIPDTVDIVFSHRLPIPPDLMIVAADAPSGCEVRVSVLGADHGSFPPGWTDRVRLIGRSGEIDIEIMDPVDAVVSMLADLDEPARADIRELAARGRLDAGEVRRRATEVIRLFVGDTAFLSRRAEEVAAIVEDATMPRS